MAVPDTVCVVKTTVTIPLASVVLVAVAKDPLPSDLVQVTTLPAVLTAFPLASASCAEIVTSAPATGLYPFEVTRYFVAAPTVVVIVVLVPVSEPASVPVIVVAVPDTVCVVKTTVAIPLASVVLVAVAKDPLLFDLVQVTISPAIATGLLLASASCAETVTPAPATGEYPLEVTRYFVATTTVVSVPSVKLQPETVALKCGR